MGHSIVTVDEFTHTDSRVVHTPTGTELHIHPELDVVTGTWVPGKKMRNGFEYDLVEIKSTARQYLKRVGVMV
jgi:hypothetical protein